MSRMNRRRNRPPRFTRFQRFVLALFGAAIILCGVSALAVGKIYFHTIPGSRMGWVFAPYALVAGTLPIGASSCGVRELAPALCHMRTRAKQRKQAPAPHTGFLAPQP